MNIKVPLKRIIFIFIYLMLGIYIISQYEGSELSTILKNNYIVLTYGYFICGGVFLLIILTKKITIFNPYIWISLIYFCILIFYPLYDILRGFLFKAGVDTSGGCIKATIIFIVSYIFFTIGYWVKFRIRNRNTNNNKIFKKIEDISSHDKSVISFLWWTISFIACLIAQISRGYSLAYIFSFGKSLVDNVTYRTGMLFLTNFGTTLVVSYILYFIYGKNKLVKIITTLLTLVYLFMRNGRWLLMIFLMAPVIYYYLSKKKKINIIALISGGLFLLVCLTFIQVNRYNLTTGNRLETEGVISIENMLKPLESDFSTYKTYYGIVEAFPEKHDYMYGDGMVGYTTTLMIPRAIWPTKPEAPMYEVVEAALNERAVLQGEAYPNIAEYYSEFGVLGCFVLMFLFGYIISKSEKLLYYNTKCSLALYSCFLPFCYQFTARSFAPNVYAILFGVLPIITLSIYTKIKKGNR